MKGGENKIALLIDGVNLSTSAETRSASTSTTNAF